MGRLDIDALLCPVSDVSPCGVNLEYDPIFGELERAAEGTPEQVIGNAITKAEPPDWPTVLEMGAALFDRTKDLRVALCLTRALLVTDGIAGFQEGLELTARLLSERWDTFHPQLDPEDGNDPTLRINVLAQLCSRETILKDLKSAPLARSPRLGMVNYRHISLATGELKPVDGSAPKEMTEIVAVFADCDGAELLATAAAARACARILGTIEEVLTAQVSVTLAVDFAPALTLMRHIVRFLDERVAERGLASEAPPGGIGVPEVETGAPIAAAVAAPIIPAQVSSRDDVIRSLDCICAYYARYEPSSPIPLLLARARRLVSKDFMEVLRDIAPDAVAQAEALRGGDGS
ncbi:MAG: type VI secretion system protein TssA [Rhodospirillales bacterium]